MIGLDANFIGDVKRPSKEILADIQKVDFEVRNSSQKNLLRA
jgi:hypothetical protein